MPFDSVLLFLSSASVLVMDGAEELVVTVLEAFLWPGGGGSGLEVSKPLRWLIVGEEGPLPGATPPAKVPPCLTTGLEELLSGLGGGFGMDS